MALKINNQIIGHREIFNYINNEVRNVVYNNIKVWHKSYVFGDSPVYLFNADNPKGMPTLSYSLTPSSTVLNLANGLFRTTHLDISEGNGVNSLEISHIYNSELNCDFVNESLRTHMGVGFKLNVQQYLIQVSDSEYKYIDADGIVHKIINHNMFPNFFYDTSGLGLILSFASDGTKYLTDRVGNKLTFNNLNCLVKSETVLGDDVNFEYNDGKITGVKRGYGTSLDKHYFKLYYNDDNLLTSINSQYQDETKTIQFEYDGFDRLIKVFKQKGTINENIIEYNYYDNSHRLKRIINLQKSAIEFSYDIDGKVNSINEGAITLNDVFNSRRNDSFIYANQTIDNPRTSTKVTSNQGVVYVYNYDNKTKRTLGVYEEFLDNNLYSYSSVSPSPNLGFRVMENAAANENSFNGCKIVTPVEDIPFNSWTISNNSTTLLLDRLREINGEVRKFTCSAWVRVREITDSSKLELRFATGDEIHEEVSANIDLSPSKLDKWQFISCEREFSAFETIHYFKTYLYRENKSIIKIDVSDIRVTFNDTVTYVEHNHIFDIRDIDQVTFNNVNWRYQIKDIREAKKDEMFLTAQDIEATLYNKCVKSIEGRFNFVHSNGTGTIPNVTSIQFRNKKNQIFSLSYNSLNGAGFYNRTTMDNNLIFDKYYVYEIDRYHHYIKAKKSGLPSTEEKSTYTYSGLLKEKMDEYGVQTIYEHDAYGNVTKSTIKNIQDTDPYTIKKIVNTYIPTEDNENIKEVIDDRGYTSQFSYVNPQGNLHTFIDQAKTKKTEMVYDVFNEKLKGVKTYTRLNQSDPFNSTPYSSNSFYYNELGQLRELAHNNIRYDIEYDLHGNVTKQLINDVSIFNKTYNYNNANTNIETTYSNNSSIKYRDVYDKYGRHLSKQEGDQNKLIHTFKNRGDKDIASSEAKLKESFDYFSNIKYEYHYNDEDLLTGYTQKSLDNSNIDFYIKAANPEDTDSPSSKRYRYKLNNAYDSILITYDDSKFINPRILNINGYDTTYTYDELGRIETKRSGNRFDEYYYLPNVTVIGLDIIVTTTNKLEKIITKSRDYNVFKSQCIYEYDENGNVKTTTISKSPNNDKYDKRVYEYDKLNRLKKETLHSKDTDTQEITQYIIDYSYDAYGNILTKKETTFINNESSMVVTRTYIYDEYFKDQVKRIFVSATEVGVGPLPPYYEEYTYDSIGNPTIYRNNVLTWKRGGLLDSITKDNKTTYYHYGATGIRTSKTTGNDKKLFLLDGDKIVGEPIKVGDKNCIREYIYDQNGLAYIYYFDESGTKQLFSYNVERDGQGNIIAVYDNLYNLKVRFSYDAFGKCTVLEKDDNFDLDEIPFRWKGYYYDCESDFYYINGNYYDPETGRYVHAGSFEDILNNIGEHGLNLYSFADNNPLALLPNLVSFENSMVFIPEKAKKHWLFSALLLIGGIGLIVSGFGAGVGVGLLSFGVGLGIIAFAIADLVEGKTGNNFIRNATGWNRSTYDKVRMGLQIAALALSIYNWYRATHPRAQCFKKGTLVKTKDGHKKIEDIKVGDLVYAYDEVTKEKALKKVVRLFRNTTSVWTTTFVKVDGSDDICEITSTPGHKYYLPKNIEKRNPNEQQEHASYEELSVMWVSAHDLKTGDKVLLSSGKYGIIVKMETKVLDEPETTYNFEVADFHTYYVGEASVCVHNAACDWEWGKGSFDSVDHSFNSHAFKHGKNLGLDPSDTVGYFKKATNVADNVIQGKIPGKLDGGFTPNVRYYDVGPNRIHLTYDPVTKKGVIYSFYRRG